MTLRVRDVGRHTRHSLRGVGTFSDVEIANAAGQSLCNAHPWAWLITTSTGLDIVAGQDWIDLPPAREILAIQETGTDGGWVRLSGGHREMLSAKQGWLSVGGVWRIMPSYRRDANNVPVRILELAPTPTEAQANAFRIWFHGDWTTLVDDDSIVPVPAWLEPCFIEYARAFAHGWQYPERGTASDLLAAFKASSTWLDALATDGELAGPIGSLLPYPSSRMDDTYIWTVPERNIIG